MRVSVLGAGGWGTALALLLASRRHEVALWARRPEHAAELERTRENRGYLPGHRFPPAVNVTADLAAALADDGLTFKERRQLRADLNAASTTYRQQLRELSLSAQPADSRPKRIAGRYA